VEDRRKNTKTVAAIRFIIYNYKQKDINNLLIVDISKIIPYTD
jgi:hypothetical protein